MIFGLFPAAYVKEDSPFAIYFAWQAERTGDCSWYANSRRQDLKEIPKSNKDGFNKLSADLSSCNKAGQEKMFLSRQSVLSPFDKIIAILRSVY